jgi:hypothetical protein
MNDDFRRKLLGILAMILVFALFLAFPMWLVGRCAMAFPRCLL